MAIALNSDTKRYFDPVEYIKNLRKVGVSQDAAEVQAQAMEEIVHSVLNSGHLATKHDLTETELRLQKEIEKLRYETLKFAIFTGVGVVASLGGMIAKGFHWW